MCVSAPAYRIPNAHIYYTCELNFVSEATVVPEAYVSELEPLTLANYAMESRCL